MRVCVVGLGKIGLPLAAQYAAKGHRVMGADIAPDVVERIMRGEADAEEPGLAERVGAAVHSGHLTATTDTAAAVRECDVVVVVVPLVVDAQAEPDFAVLDAATADVARGLQPGTLVIYETTLPIGTTRERLAPALSRGSGLSVGSDLFVCFSPERVFTGRVFTDLCRYPKLIGGVDEASAERASRFYDAVLDFDERPDLREPNGVWDLGSAEAAEFAKLMETTYRDVNIGLANQFARHADELGIEVLPIISAANSQPFSHVHQPGIAVGGHCIPVYPRLYMSTDTTADLVRSARERNESMPGYAVARLEERIGHPLAGVRVAVLGAAYRGGVKETAFSGVFGVVGALRRRGAEAVVHDPLYDAEELTALGFDCYELGSPCGAAVVQADHEQYRGLRPGDLPGVEVLLDGRAFVESGPWREAGIPVVTIGGG